jgi:hypothetical protein
MLPKGSVHERNEAPRIGKYSSTRTTIVPQSVTCRRHSADDAELRPNAGTRAKQAVTWPRKRARSEHTQHHDRPGYAFMVFCQSIITLVARLRIDRRLGTLRPTSKRPPLAFALSRSHMEFPALRGRSILVVEDELLIGMDIRRSLEEAGAGSKPP